MVQNNRSASNENQTHQVLDFWEGTTKENPRETKTKFEIVTRDLKSTTEIYSGRVKQYTSKTTLADKTKNTVVDKSTTLNTTTTVINFRSKIKDSDIAANEIIPKEQKINTPVKTISKSTEPQTATSPHKAKATVVIASTKESVKAPTKTVSKKIANNFKNCTVIPLSIQYKAPNETISRKNSNTEDYIEENDLINDNIDLQMYFNKTKPLALGDKADRIKMKILEDMKGIMSDIDVNAAKPFSYSTIIPTIGINDATDPLDIMNDGDDTI
jgi:hypothetical protein